MTRKPWIGPLRRAASLSGAVEEESPAEAGVRIGREPDLQVFAPPPRFSVMVARSRACQVRKPGVLRHLKQGEMCAKPDALTVF